jgi:type IV secretion system protein VirB1
VGAQILTDCYGRALKKYRDEQVAIRAALSCYQSGNFSTGFRTGYVGKVVAAALPGS